MPSTFTAQIEVAADGQYWLVGRAGDRQVVELPTANFAAAVELASTLLDFEAPSVPRQGRTLVKAFAISLDEIDGRDVRRAVNATRRLARSA